jgi:hypothetical protein
MRLLSLPRLVRAVAVSKGAGQPGKAGFRPALVWWPHPVLPSGPPIESRRFWLLNYRAVYSDGCDRTGRADQFWCRLRESNPRTLLTRQDLCH